MPLPKDLTLYPNHAGLCGQHHTAEFGDNAVHIYFENGIDRNILALIQHGPELVSKAHELLSSTFLEGAQGTEPFDALVKILNKIEA